MGRPPGVWPSGGLPPPAVRGAGDLTVAIDPGHGGIDPGAVRDGAQEKSLVLAFGLALRDALVARGFRVVMSREGDDYVPLADRVAGARRAGADLFLSIHLNAESDPGVAGVIAFTRADRGTSEQASARARLENAADTLAGLDAVELGDPVRDVLVGMARTETDARSGILADALVAALRPVAAVWAEPRQAADFEVLRAPDMPSVLLELGFLSNSRRPRRAAVAGLAGRGERRARRGARGLAHAGSHSGGGASAVRVGVRCGGRTRPCQRSSAAGSSGAGTGARSRHRPGRGARRREDAHRCGRDRSRG